MIRGFSGSTCLGPSSMIRHVTSIISFQNYIYPFFYLKIFVPLGIHNTFFFVIKIKFIEMEYVG